MKYFKNLNIWWKGQDISAAKESLSKDASSLGTKAVVLGTVALITPEQFIATVVAKALGVDAVPVLALSNGWVATVLLVTGLFLLSASFLLSMKPKVTTASKKKAAKKPA